MLKKLTTGIALGALALATPLAAQEEVSSEDARVLDALSGMFGEADPLSAEQEASLPAAKDVVAKIFPEGTYAKMMEESMKPMMDGMMGAMLKLPASELANLTGLGSSDLENMGEGTLGEAMAIMDPDYEQRSRIIGDTTVKMITDLMNEIEPSYRAGLARAYAVRFSQAELTELSRFFSTPTGSHYAEESMLIYTDPQVMSAMNEMMPAMMEMMPNMMEAMTTATAELREPRKYSELSEEEQAQLAKIFGVAADDLAAAEPGGDEEWEYEEEAEEGAVEDAT